MKVVVAPDSFKGTLSAQEICKIALRALSAVMPDCQVVSLPIADGGEGTVDCMLTVLGGTKIFKSITGPLGEKTDGFFGLSPDGETAIVEVAAAVGLPLVQGREDVLNATSKGVGELIAAALDEGANSFIIGLGGSCTNDGGVGMAHALGVRFLDSTGTRFLPTGGNLDRIQTIDISNINPRLKEVNITAMSDISNPLYGTHGAAYVFAAQKGATREDIVVLDNGLRHLANRVEACLGIDCKDDFGAGAAGGLGYGLIAFLGANARSGIDTLLDVAKFEKLLDGADAVITGEGRLDSQSLDGKAVVGVAKRAAAVGVSVYAVVGCTGDGYEKAFDVGVKDVFVSAPKGLTFDEIKRRAQSDLYEAMLKAAQKIKENVVC